MSRLAALAFAAASALCVHCSSNEGYDDEGRVYAAIEAFVTRSATSLIDRPIDPGDAIYVTAFEIPGGFVRAPFSDAHLFIEFAPGVTLGDGDEPVVCSEYALSAEATLRHCAALSSGADGADADLSSKQVYRYWVADLPRSLDPVDVRRVSFEVRRPEAAPSLEAAALKLWVVDGSCDKVLATRANAAACNPAAGEDCSWVDDYSIEVDSVVCRMRYQPGT